MTSKPWWVLMIGLVGVGCDAGSGGPASQTDTRDVTAVTVVLEPDSERAEDVTDTTQVEMIDDVSEVDAIDHGDDAADTSDTADVADTTVAEDVADTVADTTVAEDSDVTEPPRDCLDAGTCVRWSDPATWGGTKPVAGDAVTIPAGKHVLLDEDPPALAGLSIVGTLQFERADHTLSASWIMVHGALVIGSEAAPFEQRATLLLTGSDTNDDAMGMGTRGIVVMGGDLQLHGAPPTAGWRRLASHAQAGATTLVLEDVVDWRAADRLVIAPTDFYYVGASERLTVASVTGDVVSLAAPLTNSRWGRLQFVTPDGMRESPDAVITPPVAGTPVVLDERAEVGNLTRNIRIEAPDDDAWRSSGLGVHVMIMGPGSAAHVDGVAIRRAGQRGRLGRYPFHWHRLSYDDTKALGDASGQYLRNSSIDESQNRGVVIHATNGVTVADNVIHDVLGHGIFTEDAVERRNVIRGNLVLHTRNPSANAALKQHEIFENGGASGLWISNPDNIIRDNVTADCQGHGIWLAFPANAWGSSIGVPMRPNRIQFGVFDGNSVHSNGFEGLMFDFVESDSAGNVSPLEYFSTSDGADPSWNSGTLRRFAVSRLTTWKNGRGGVWDRVAWPDFTEVVSADNCSRFFAGSGADGLIAESLLVGTSMNSASPRPRVHYPDSFGGDESPTAFATYHSAFDIRDNVVVQFPLVAGKRSGAFATDDYYLRPLEKGLIRNSDNLLIGSHPGLRATAVFDHYVLAGAVWDPYGYWGPANDYFVYDTPFFTYGQTVTPVMPAGQTGGVSVPGPFYGVQQFVINHDRPYYHPLMALAVTRRDPITDAAVGAWSVAEALSEAWFLSPMRHFAAHRDGIYDLAFPGAPMPTDLEMRVDNLLSVDDTLVLGVQFSGAIVPSAVYTMAQGSAPSVRAFTAVDSRAAVAASAGRSYWQDRPNNRVWVKLQGGSWQFWDTTGAEAVPTSDELLYRQLILAIESD